MMLNEPGPSRSSGIPWRPTASGQRCSHPKVFPVGIRLETLSGFGFPSGNGYADFVYLRLRGENNAGNPLFDRVQGRRNAGELRGCWSGSSFDVWRKSQRPGHRERSSMADSLTLAGRRHSRQPNEQHIPDKLRLVRTVPILSKVEKSRSRQEFHQHPGAEGMPATNGEGGSYSRGLSVEFQAIPGTHDLRRHSNVESL